MTVLKKTYRKSSPAGKIPAADLSFRSVAINKFGIIRQSTATNKLTMMKTTVDCNADDPDILRVKNDNLIVTLENFSTLDRGIKTTTHRLLDAVMIRCTESGSKENTVFLSLDEYAAMCGLKNIKQIRKQINSEIKTLTNMKISFSRSSNREQSFSNIKICNDARIKNNFLVFRFSDEFFRIIKSMPVMPYPMKLFTINHKKNPNSYYFLRKISEHKKMNYFKKNADTISVKTLLECTPELPKYEYVVSGDRAVNRRIIEPFERDMNQLEDVFSWEFCHSNGTPLLDCEINNFSYNVFSRLMVRVKWIDYPEISRKPNTNKKGSAVRCLT